MVATAANLIPKACSGLRQVIFNMRLSATELTDDHF